MHGRRRVLAGSLQALFQRFPCVAVLGARQVGKTTILQQILPDVPLFDLEKDSDFERISRDPEFFLEDNVSPLIFDEAQLCPTLFSALRVKIDKNRNQAGQYLISGSSSPELLFNLSESLAGRIAIVELGTFHFEESWEQPPSPVYKLLMTQDVDKLKQLPQRYSRNQLYQSCLYGGYPEPFLNRNDELFYDSWMENYMKTYINRDIRRLFPGLQIETFKRFIRMLGMSSGDSINLSGFAKSLDVSQPTVKSYFDIAEGTFLWRIFPSYHRNLKKRLVKMPKGYFRDTGLVNYLLKINNVEDLKAHPRFGNIWETFITEQIIKNFQAHLIPFDYYYYRTSNQAEVDLLLEGKFGLIPIEIKSGYETSSYQLRSLSNFISEYNCPFGILINNGNEIVHLSRKIVQIPATFL